MRRPLLPSLSDRLRQTALNWKASLWLLLVIVLVMAAAQQAAAQGQIESINGLELRLWPDFDRPAVLATLIGEVSTSASGPIPITLPLPDGAAIHVVAPLRFDGSPGPEIPFDDSIPGEVTFSVEPPGFWVEFYFPYEADGSQRDIRYTWQSDFPVDSLSAIVQQPLMAADMTTDPEAERVTTGSEGMLYHHIPNQTVAAGSLYTLDVSYTMVRDQLSVDALGTQGDTGDVNAGDEGVNWVLIFLVIAGAVAVIAVVWLVVTRRSSKRRIIRPRPVRPVKSKPLPRDEYPPAAPTLSASRFCHECGQPVEQGDRFCRNCGTAVKQ